MAIPMNTPEQLFEKWDREANHYDYDMARNLAPVIREIEKKYSKRKEELQYHWGYNEAKKQKGNAEFRIKERKEVFLAGFEAAKVPRQKPSIFDYEMDDHERKYWENWERDTQLYCIRNHISLPKFESWWHYKNRIDGTPYNYQSIRGACFDSYALGVYVTKYSIAQAIFEELEAKPETDKEGVLLPIISPVIGWRERDRYEAIKRKYLPK
jgi:hypothetical protein